MGIRDFFKSSSRSDQQQETIRAIMAELRSGGKEFNRLEQAEILQQIKSQIQREAIGQMEDAKNALEILERY